MNQQSFIYKFLLTPQFRVWRYLALIIFFTIVSLNQALTGYKDIIPLMGRNIYWIVSGTILFYIMTVFLVLRTILKYLLSGKYILFIISIILCAASFTAIPNIVSTVYIDGYDLFSETTIIDNLSAFVIYILCISGVIIPVFLRNWMISNQHLGLLKIKQESSQVEQLKEQINPTSFFKILNKSGSLVKTDPDKASTMLMKLGQLLRYQLYDCNRAQVLVSAEISFLRNFLDLEKLYSPKFNYTINPVGNINGIFISPSILLPYVQNIMNTINYDREMQTMDIQINNLDKSIQIIISITITSNSSLQRELLKVEERLNTLYRDHYKLIVSDKNENTKISLELDKI